MKDIDYQQPSVSTTIDNHQNYSSTQEQKAKRVTGPGTDDYYKDKWLSYNQQEPEVAEEHVVKESFFRKAGTYFKKLNPFKSEEKELQQSLLKKINLLKKEINEDSEHLNYPFNQQLLLITEQIEKELEKKPNWVRLELLVRQFVLLIEQKGSQNDLEQSQQTRDRSEKTVDKLQKTYNSPLQVCSAAVESGINLFGGAVGLSAGLKLTNMGLKTAQAITSGSQALSSGVRPFGQMTNESNASSRQGLEHEKQKRYQQKSQSDELRRNSENSKSRKKAESDSAIREDNEAKKQMLRAK